ncbi:glycosyltransferase [Nitriliruptor alkaliphilus]|uniref:glycosyltransferase n=1 Tax=Nitriliruptor alkaliphilus TaxID=427918 RepID=UPI000698124B|nr:nucleotide disphospho-sugar-binding domain-containing protein [Nitriliruptor alkaliphilus]
MATIGCIVGPDPGHALPVLGIGAALRRRGHEVTVWTGRRHASLAAHHDLAWRELPLLAPQPGDEDLGVRLHARPVGMARALTPDVARTAPDLLIVDTLTRAGALTAGLLDVPHVEVVPHHLPDPALDLPPVGLGRPLPRTPWRRLDDRQIVRRQLASHAVGERQASAAAADLGLSAWPGADLRLLQTLPSLERARGVWPTDTVIAGPLALDPALPPLLPPDGDAPLVVVTDSTATALDRSLAETAIRALQSADVRLVVTTAGLPARRDGRIVVGLAPHGPLLAHADVAVSPGGGGFITKAAAAAVPQVVVPLAGDQREAAARLRDVHAARIVRPSRCTPRALRWAIVRALSDTRSRAVAARLAAEAAELGPEFAAERCLALLATAQGASA